MKICLFGEGRIMTALKYYSVEKYKVCHGYEMLLSPQNNNQS
jgi:hypothetical protein